MTIHAYFKCFICFQMYIAIVLFGCFKSKFCVVSCHSPAAAGAPPWFTCQCLRPAGASAARIRCGVGAVPPCGCGMGPRRGSAVRMRDGRGEHGSTVQGAVPDTGIGWERNRACGIRCGHGARELCPGAGLGRTSGTASNTQDAKSQICIVFISCSFRS
jgi:hypothetical protein